MGRGGDAALTRRGGGVDTARRRRARQECAAAGRASLAWAPGRQIHAKGRRSFTGPLPLGRPSSLVLSGKPGLTFIPYCVADPPRHPCLCRGKPGLTFIPYCVEVAPCRPALEDPS